MDLPPMLTPVRDIGAFIREQRTSAQISLRQLAVKAGVSNPYLSQVERGLRNPSADILAQIARALQISVEGVLAKAGILDHDGQAPVVELAIEADPDLTARQKASLLDIYRAFLGESRQGRNADRDTGRAGDPADPVPGTDVRPVSETAGTDSGAGAGPARETAGPSGDAQFKRDRDPESGTAVADPESGAVGPQVRPAVAEATTTAVQHRI